MTHYKFNFRCFCYAEFFFLTTATPPHESVRTVVTVQYIKPYLSLLVLYPNFIKSKRWSG